MKPSYTRGCRVVLLPVSQDHGKEFDAETREQLGEEYLKELAAMDLIDFDIASVICHLDERREIQSVDVVLPDLTAYHAKRDHKTPAKP